MTYGFLLVLVLMGDLFADGRTEGRRGNEAYGEGNFQAASEAYRQGLSEAVENDDRPLLFGLTNNLGASQYRLEQLPEALETFETAAVTASDPASRAVAEYNAGNAAFKTQDLERALAHYRQALLQNPADVNAKFNYEFVKRQLQEQGGEDQQQQGGDQQEQQQQQQGEQESQDDESREQDQQNQPPQDQEQQGQPPQDQDQQQQRGRDQTEDQEAQDQQEPQTGAQPQEPLELGREQAERILQALENEEAELLREVQRIDAPPRRVEKDW